MKLPLWLAEPLARKRIGALTIPKTHAKAIRHELRADAATVSMAQNQFIYEMGAVLATLTGDTELPTILASTFTARFAQLWDSARNWTTEDTATATATMCHSEKKCTLPYVMTLKRSEGKKKTKKKTEFYFWNAPEFYFWNTDKNFFCSRS